MTGRDLAEQKMAWRRMCLARRRARVVRRGALERAVAGVSVEELASLAGLASASAGLASSTGLEPVAPASALAPASAELASAELASANAPESLAGLASSTGLEPDVRGATIAGYRALGSELDVSELLAGWVDAGGIALVPTPGAMSAGRFGAPRWVRLGRDGTPDPHAPAPHVPSPQAPGPQAPEPYAPDPHVPDPLTPASYAPAPRTPETDTLAGAAVVLVPGLAFGVDGARLGRGAGWYDRALATAAGSLTLGVCFEDEVVGAGLLPVEPHDLPVDGVLTPRGVTLF